jgi:hypothetical protein
MKCILMTVTVSVGLLFGSLVMAEEPQQAAPAQTQEEPAEVIEIKAEKPSVNDRYCLRETGTNIRNKGKQRCHYSAGRSYSREDIERTGSIDIGQALERLDPSISVRRY